MHPVRIAANVETGTWGDFRLAPPPLREARDARNLINITTIVIMMMIILIIIIITIIIIMPIKQLLLIINMNMQLHVAVGRSREHPWTFLAPADLLWRSISLEMSPPMLLRFCTCEERFYTPQPPGSNFRGCKYARIETKASIHQPLWVVVCIESVFLYTYSYICNMCMYIYI